jgi:hypothetical protein
MLHWESTRFSRIAYEVASYIFNRRLHILRFDPLRLTSATLRRFADALTSHGCPLTNCWVFLNETLRQVAWPLLNQRSVPPGVAMSPVGGVGVA